MGIATYLPVLPDGGGRLYHRECRDCGVNLEDGEKRCPVCNGEVVVYDL